MHTEFWPHCWKTEKFVNCFVTIDPLDIEYRIIFQHLSAQALKEYDNDNVINTLSPQISNATLSNDNLPNRTIPNSYILNTNTCIPNSYIPNTKRLVSPVCDWVPEWDIPDTDRADLYPCCRRSLPIDHMTLQRQNSWPYVDVTDSERMT